MSLDQTRCHGPAVITVVFPVFSSVGPGLCLGFVWSGLPLFSVWSFGYVERFPVPCVFPVSWFLFWIVVVFVNKPF